jgi:tetratricopeptide (TPR) repeat protein
LGVTYYEAELYEDAEDSFLRALTLDPQFAETHLGLSNLYIKIQEWDRALFHLEAFLVDRPNREDADILRNVRLRIQNIIEKEEGRF